MGKPFALGLIGTPSTCSLGSDIAGLSPRSTESGVPFFIRSSQLSDTSTSIGLRSALLAWLASLMVTAYDVVMRVVMPSWYLLDLHLYDTAAAYLRARADKKTRRYVEHASERFAHALATNQISMHYKTALEPCDYEFARDVFCHKHGKPWALYAAWCGFVSIMTGAPDNVSFSTVTETATGSVVALFVEFRQGNDCHHFITALVSHEASKKYGIYVAKYEQMINGCTQDGVAVLRCGPTTDDLKAGLGGIRFPLFVVGTPVWARLQGRCSVISFGIFTTLGVFAYLWLTQWMMDASGMGRLSPGEFLLLYTCCIAFVKVLPFFSIGIWKVLSNPRKYLLQTSFYAQGVIFGAVLFIAIASYARGISPLKLLDALSIFALVGDMIGRLGCHFYGCCFGRPVMHPGRAFTAGESSKPNQPQGPQAPAPAPASGAEVVLKQAGHMPLGTLTATLVAATGSASVNTLTPEGGSPAAPSSLTASTAGSQCSSWDEAGPQEVASTAAHVRTPAAAAAAPATGKKDPQGSSPANARRLPPFHPLAVLYLDKASSVSRLRPEYRLLPLLPTQVMQALFATVVQLCIVMTLIYNPVLKTGVIGCAAVGAYSIGRILFFLVRDDEKYKSNRSYTTAYVALGTLAGCAVAAVYAQLWCDTVTHFPLAAVPSSGDALAYTLVAGVTALINFLVQALHHHEQVGRFPDMAALFARPTRLGARRQRSLGGKQQVWSSWGGAASGDALVGPGMCTKSE